MGPNPETGVRPFQCGSCLEDIDYETRRTWHCGWIDESEWSDGVPMYPVVPGYEESICPGYMLTKPFVNEAQIAVAALRLGQLSEYYPDEQACVKMAAMELHGAYNIYEAEQLSKK